MSHSRTSAGMGQVPGRMLNPRQPWPALVSHSIDWSVPPYICTARHSVRPTLGVEGMNAANPHRTGGRPRISPRVCPQPLLIFGLMNCY